MTRTVTLVLAGALLAAPAAAQEKPEDLKREIEKLRDELKREKETSERLRQELQRERDRAEANLRRAREAVDRALTGAAERQPDRGAGATRKELLQRAAEHYEKLLKDPDADPVAVAAAAVKLAKVQAELGETDKAQELLRRSVELLTKRITEFPAEAGPREGLADAYAELGGLLVRLGRPAEAEAALRKAQALFEALVRAQPDQTRYHQKLGRAHAASGRLYLMVGRVQEAEASLLRALAVSEQLLKAAPPGQVEIYADYADTLQTLALLFRSTRRPAEAEAVLRKAMETRTRLVELVPAVPEHRRALAAATLELAALYQQQGKLAEAEALVRRGLEVRTRLV